jgi:hypothetical protein
MGRRASAGEGRRSGGGSIQLHPSAGGAWMAARGAAATDRTGGGGSGGRWETAGLTDRVGPPVSEGEAMGRLGQKGREEVAHDWAGKGGRRWATAGLEKDGGGRAEIVARAEIQNSKKKKSISIDFWIKIGLEIE